MEASSLETRVRGESVKSVESSVDCVLKCVHMQSIANQFTDNDNNNNEYEPVKPMDSNHNIHENERNHNQCNNSEHLANYIVDNRNNSEQNHTIMTSSAQMAAKCTTTTTSCTTNATNTTTMITKNERFKQSIQHSVSDKTKKKITSLIGEIDQFNDIEKLLLYMQLPNGASQEVDPLKQKGPGNPFGKKADIEVAQTYTWIQSHLEEDSSVSLPKQEVYEEYKAFCDINKFEPLCVADFGKAMKHVFPRVKPRRLGQRGNSKYCYSGLRKKLNIEPPELPLIDTSSYDSYKSNCNRNADDSEIHSDESLEKSTLSITSAATTLILEWADKQLNCSSESLIDLAEYLLKSGLVDSKSFAALTLKSTQQQTKSHSKSAISKRRDVQNQLQKKLQEKEQKKKMEQAFNAKNLKKNRKNKTDECEFTAVTQFTSQHNNMITVKKEPDIEISPFHATQPKYIQQTRIHANKVAIPRTGTPSRPAISTPSIILVQASAVRLSSPHASLTTESQSTSTTMSAMCSTSPLKSATSKYKKIQPKPVNICRSDSESAVSVVNSAFDGCIVDALNATVKRRHSLSAPLTLSTSIKLKNDTYTEKQLQVKRQIEERDYSALTCSKKRHVDSTDSFMLSNNTNTNSSGFDDQNSSNSLSPISQESQPFTNNDVLRTSDIKIQELENEALIDYFSSTNSNKDQWDINGNGINVVNSHNNNNGNNNTNNNNSADISQLRKLLQNVIPNVNVQQKRVETSQLEACSELREALLRKNLNNSVQTFESFKTNDKNGDNNGSVILNLKENVEFGKCRQIDGLVTSPVLEKIHCISNNCLIGMNSLTNTNSLFTENSTISHNVQIQVPSVPPSPNARRLAFNFQPIISPRNTPTIPENAPIDVNGYNNAYTTAMNSPPQYRVNQQTVGVGPSQPSSEANSPFVSPRSTPIPLCRSRHNSGQSNYSALRQTPLQNFDSGVSSISSSPFISPQSTPVPISRNRTVSMRNIARARHSSGPGGPCNMTHATASLLCHRSNSLSPMIGDNFLRDGTTLAQPLIFNNELHSQMNSPVLSNSNGTTSLTPVTPVSPLSPSNMLQHSEINSINTDLIGSSNEFLLNGDNEVLQSSEWQPQTNAKLKSSLTHSLVNRCRHSSNPYTGPSTSISHNNIDSYSSEYSNEIFSFMKNSNDSESTLCSALSQKSVVNRCQSVPMHQMIQSNNMKNVHQLSVCSAATKSENEAIMHNEMANISKSYPATPICNQNFHFPPSPPSSTKLQSVIGGDDIISGNVLQSGQDVMVSGIQLAENAIWNSNIGNTQQTDDLISITVNGINSSANVRRNLNALLAEPPDDLDTTLEDLRDCDNDFSKFARELELEASCYDDLS